MFSGIVERKAKIIKIEQGRFTVENIFREKLSLGQSISHDGAFMTIESLGKNIYTFFVMKESLKKTNFWTKKHSDTFNVERSLKLSDRIDWHFVSGHIDSTWRVKAVRLLDDSSKIIDITFPKKFQNYCIEKWSVTINGVSLTIVSIKEQALRVSIIPLTQNITNLGNLKKGDIVNLEFDMLGKYIYKLMKNYVWL